MTERELISQLDDADGKNRLAALTDLKARIDRGEMQRPEEGSDVNNHIHTRYSFSPYYPAKAVWMAYLAGLKTAGLMDHDSISGAEEFIRAGEILGLMTTIGVECRVSMKQSPFAERRLNNPDQVGIAYVALHGIPHQNIPVVKSFFAPYIAARNRRNQQMVQRLNDMFALYGIFLDFEQDVIPLSLHQQGGTVTERHLLFALGEKIIRRVGKGLPLVSFLSGQLGLSISFKNESFLSDITNPFYEYDLLNALKSNLVEKFYVDAEEECPDGKDFIDLAEQIGAISAYAYLGDVGDSVTGDKKTQQFEDAYLDELLPVLQNLGFRAVTYMPSRNTPAQLERIRRLCEHYGFFQISGEDINSPRQSFICEAQRAPEFRHLYHATLALIGHEKAATKDIGKAMFSRQSIETYPDLQERILIYKNIGKGDVVV